MIQALVLTFGVLSLAFLSIDSAAQPAPVPSGRLAGEAMYPRTSREMWKEVQAMAKALKWGVAKKNDANQVLVTRWVKYDAQVLPDASQLGFSATDRVLRVEWHIFVFPGRDPARLAAGAIVELERRREGGADIVFAYRPSALEEWFFKALDDRIGVLHEPMAGTWDARVEQALRLMPAGSKDPCVPTPPVAPSPRKTPAVALDEVQPVFPAEGHELGETTTLVGGQITEHGTATTIKIVNPIPKLATFEASARAAAGLWRFRPVTVNGCPVPSFMQISIAYRLH